MVFSILTLFPEMFDSPLNFSIIKRAQDQQKVSINIINIRDFSEDKYRTVDDHPYGGGVGMIMRVDVIDRALTDIKNKYPNLKTKSVLLDARGMTYNQQLAQNFSDLEHLIIICGHYEGVDHRIFQLVDEIVSVGNYVLTGGEIPALVIIDSVTRLVDGVLKPIATEDESFSNHQLAPPQYTRPENYKNMRVPQVLLSGDPKKINLWKLQNSKTLPTK